MRTRRRAFTLVELLVVIGIIALLISILLPALSRARKNANTLKCQSNIRQLCTSLVMYAGDNKGKFPPNCNDLAAATGVATPSGLQNYAYWYDQDRIGKYLPKTVQYGSGSVGGNVFICPEDQDAARSYAMNIWGSSPPYDSYVKQSFPNGGGTTRGSIFGTNVKNGTSMILVSEKFSVNGAPGTYAAGSTIGYQGTKPGTRFIGNLAIATGGRFGTTPTELDFSRHRSKGDGGFGVEARGRIVIGFADGHVEQYQADQLADRTTGKSRFVALWSPIDRQLDP